MSKLFKRIENMTKVPILNNNLNDIINTVKQYATAKFDETIDIVVKVNINPKKESLRGSTIVPYGIAKKIKICIFTDENTDYITKSENITIGGLSLIDDIKNNKPFFADVCLTTPSFFPKLVPIAKTLGQLKLMPNIKDNTVTTNIESTIKELQSGKKINYRNDSAGYLHIKVGKKSFDNNHITENIKEVIKSINTHNKQTKGILIQSIKINSTMGYKAIEIPVKFI